MSEVKSTTSFEKIPVVLLVTPKYQRKLLGTKVDSIVNNYDANLMDDILVSKRDGQYWVVDGGHRVAAMRKMGFKEASCRVIYGLTYEEEAKLFADFNTSRRHLQSGDVLVAKIESKDVHAMSMVAVLNAYGYICGNQVERDGAIRISAVKAIECSYEVLGHDMFEKMVSTIRATWPLDRDVVKASMINGLTDFYKLYGDKIKPNTFVRNLKGKSPSQILANAQSYSAINQNLKNLRVPIVKILRDEYNFKQIAKNRLPNTLDI